MVGAEGASVERLRWPGGFAAFLWVVVRRTAVTLLRGEALGALFWPVLVAALIWLLVGWLTWEPVTTALQAWLTPEGRGATPESAVPPAEPGGGEAGWWLAALAVGVKVLFWLGLLPLIYVTALLLIALWALPRLVPRIARRDYPELRFRRGGSFWGSLRRTLSAVALFLLGLLATLPLWWIPGALFLFPFLLTAWLNQRTFVYDCLSEVADTDELVTLPDRYRGWLFAVGVGGALLAWLPVVNLLSPVLVGILFTHATLELLRWERQQQTRCPAEPPPEPPTASSSLSTSSWELLQ